MLAKCFPARAFVMLADSCAIAALAAPGLGLVTLFFDAVISAGLVFVMIPAIALAVQGSVAVELVRVGYL